MAGSLEGVGQVGDVPQVPRPQRSSLHPGHNRVRSVQGPVSVRLRSGTRGLLSAIACPSLHQTSLRSALQENTQTSIEEFDA